MYFTIKEMADQLGVTTHKLRYYEKEGIIEPRINEATGYRYYSVRDTRRFNASRLYRAYGLSISECKELMSGEADFDYLLDALDAQDEAMQKEIEFLLDKRSSFLFWKPYLSNIMLDLGNVRPVRFPRMHRLMVAENEKPLRGKARRECFEKWLQVFPIAGWASRIRKEDMVSPRSEIVPYDYGLNIPENYLRKYSLEAEGITEPVEGGLYLYTVFRKDTDDPFNLEPLAPIVRYMQKHGLHIAGDGFSNCLYSSKEDGEVANYHYYMVRADREAIG